MADVAEGAQGREPDSWRKLWFRVAARGALLVLSYFAAWEVLEVTLFAQLGLDLHVLHIVRGSGAAFLLATWSFLQIRRARLESDAEREAQMQLLERRVAERTRELEDARAFTELLFDSLRERIVVVDDGGRVVKANRVALGAFGASLVGQKYDGAGHDGGRVWDLETVAVPSATGGAGYVIEVAHDVTEQRNLEAQLRHQEKMASLGVLAAGFAHDIGNPLASISTELELLEGVEDVKLLEESVGVVRQHVSRMSRTLREMVDFARRRREDATDVSIALAVADSARLVCHDPRWKTVRLTTLVPEELPPVHMVEDHLVLVLVNLMINAADAMPQGGALTIAAREVASGVELRLTDTGTGMTPDVLAAALTPLFTTKHHGRGTGLGLSVSNSVITSIGGKLALASTPGEGTTVIVTLPTRSVAHA